MEKEEVTVILEMLDALKFVQAGLFQMGSDWSDEANEIVEKAIASAEKITKK